MIINLDNLTNCINIEPTINGCFLKEKVSIERDCCFDKIKISLKRLEIYNEVTKLWVAVPNWQNSIRDSYYNSLQPNGYKIEESFIPPAVSEYVNNKKQYKKGYQDGYINLFYDRKNPLPMGKYRLVMESYGCKEKNSFYVDVITSGVICHLIANFSNFPYPDSQGMLPSSDKNKPSEYPKQPGDNTPNGPITNFGIIIPPELPPSNELNEDDIPNECDGYEVILRKIYQRDEDSTYAQIKEIAEKYGGNVHFWIQDNNEPNSGKSLILCPFGPILCKYNLDVVKYNSVNFTCEQGGGYIDQTCGNVCRTGITNVLSETDNCLIYEEDGCGNKTCKEQRQPCNPIDVFDIIQDTSPPLPPFDPESPGIIDTIYDSGGKCKKIQVYSTYDESNNPIDIVDYTETNPQNKKCPPLSVFNSLNSDSYINSCNEIYFPDSNIPQAKKCTSLQVNSRDLASVNPDIKQKCNVITVLTFRNSENKNCNSLSVNSYFWPNPPDNPPGDPPPPNPPDDPPSNPPGDPPSNPPGDPPGDPPDSPNCHKIDVFFSTPFTPPPNPPDPEIPGDGTPPNEIINPKNNCSSRGAIVEIYFKKDFNLSIQVKYLNVGDLSFDFSSLVNNKSEFEAKVGNSSYTAEVLVNAINELAVGYSSEQILATKISNGISISWKFDDLEICNTQPEFVFSGDNFDAEWDSTSVLCCGTECIEEKPYFEIIFDDSRDGNIQYLYNIELECLSFANELPEMAKGISGIDMAIDFATNWLNIFQHAASTGEITRVSNKITIKLNDISSNCCGKEPLLNLSQNASVTATIVKCCISTKCKGINVFRNVGSSTDLLSECNDIDVFIPTQIEISSCNSISISHQKIPASCNPIKFIFVGDPGNDIINYYNCQKPLLVYSGNNNNNSNNTCNTIDIVSLNNSNIPKCSILNVGILRTTDNTNTGRLCDITDLYYKDGTIYTGDCNELSVSNVSNKRRLCSDINVELIINSKSCEFNVYSNQNIKTCSTINVYSSSFIISKTCSIDVFNKDRLSSCNEISVFRKLSSDNCSYIDVFSQTIPYTCNEITVYYKPEKSTCIQIDVYSYPRTHSCNNLSVYHPKYYLPCNDINVYREDKRNGCSEIYIHTSNENYFCQEINVFRNNPSHTCNEINIISYSKNTNCNNINVFYKQYPSICNPINIFYKYIDKDCKELSIISSYSKSCTPLEVFAKDEIIIQYYCSLDVLNYQTYPNCHPINVFCLNIPTEEHLCTPLSIVNINRQNICKSIEVKAFNRTNCTDISVFSNTISDICTVVNVYSKTFQECTVLSVYNSKTSTCKPIDIFSGPNTLHCSNIDVYSNKNLYTCNIIDVIHQEIKSCTPINIFGYTTLYSCSSINVNYEEISNKCNPINIFSYTTSYPCNDITVSIKNSIIPCNPINVFNFTKSNVCSIIEVFSKGNKFYCSNIDVFINNILTPCNEINVYYEDNTTSHPCDIDVFNNNILTPCNSFDVFGKTINRCNPLDVFINNIIPVCSEINVYYEDDTTSHPCNIDVFGLNTTIPCNPFDVFGKTINRCNPLDVFINNILTPCSEINVYYEDNTTLHPCNIDVFGLNTTIPCNPFDVFGRTINRCNPLDVFINNIIPVCSEINVYYEDDTTSHPCDIDVFNNNILTPCNPFDVFGRTINRCNPLDVFINNILTPCNEINVYYEDDTTSHPCDIDVFNNNILTPCNPFDVFGKTINRCNPLDVFSYYNELCNPINVYGKTIKNCNNINIFYTSSHSCTDLDIINHSFPCTELEVYSYSNSICNDILVYEKNIYLCQSIDVFIYNTFISCYPIDVYAKNIEFCSELTVFATNIGSCYPIEIYNKTVNCNEITVFNTFEKECNEISIFTSRHTKCNDINVYSITIGLCNEIEVSYWEPWWHPSYCKKISTFADRSNICNPLTEITFKSKYCTTIDVCNVITDKICYPLIVYGSFKACNELDLVTYTDDICNPIDVRIQRISKNCKLDVFSDTRRGGCHNILVYTNIFYTCTDIINVITTHTNSCNEINVYGKTIGNCEINVFSHRERQTCSVITVNYNDKTCSELNIFSYSDSSCFPLEIITSNTVYNNKCQDGLMVFSISRKCNPFDVVISTSEYHKCRNIINVYCVQKSCYSIDVYSNNGSKKCNDITVFSYSGSICHPLDIINGRTISCSKIDIITTYTTRCDLTIITCQTGRSNCDIIKLFVVNIVRSCIIDNVIVNTPNCTPIDYLQIHNYCNPLSIVTVKQYNNEDCKFVNYVIILPNLYTLKYAQKFSSYSVHFVPPGTDCNKLEYDPAYDPSFYNNAKDYIQKFFDMFEGYGWGFSIKHLESRIELQIPFDPIYCKNDLGVCVIKSNEDVVNDFKYDIQSKEIVNENKIPSNCCGNVGCEIEVYNIGDEIICDDEPIDIEYYTD